MEQAVNVTLGGKELRIHKVNNTALYEVKFTSGGELPKRLTGMWTTAVHAQNAIGAYLTEQEAKVASDTQAAIETRRNEEIVIQEKKAVKKQTKKKVVKKTVK